MKVYLHYEEGEDKSLHNTIKLTLPKSWRTGHISQLQTVLVENYNKKMTENVLDESEFHLETSSGMVLPSDGVVEKFLKNQEDVYLKPGSFQTMNQLGIEEPSEEKNDASKSRTRVKKPLPPTPGEIETARQRKEAAAGGASSEEKKLLCKRYGCQKRYDANDNGPTACRHHVKPPIFHETRKYWACCPDKVAWDWETFQAIPGCAVSSHTEIKQGKSFLGGVDVRKELDKTGPQRIDGGSSVRTETALDKISSLRKALTKVGVSGSDFDEARDHLKQKHEDMGVKVWDKVLEEIVEIVGETLKKASSC